MAKENNEEMLLKKNDRLAIFPIQHDDMWDMYKKSVSAFWTPEELDLSKDIDDFNKLTENEKTFIKHILAFFSSSDTIVNINLGERFLNDVQVLEAKFFYAFQMAIENIHSETYSLLIDTYISDEAEKTKLFNNLSFTAFKVISSSWKENKFWGNRQDRKKLLAILKSE